MSWLDELDDDLAYLNNLDVTWGLDLDAFLQERRQQAPAAGDARDGETETIGSFQGGAVGAFSAPVGRAESETGTVDASSVPAGRAEATAAQHQLPAPTKGTVRTPLRSCRRGQRTS